MNRRSFLACAISLPTLLKAESSESGFTSLFDGTTLNGWTVQDGPSAAFYVKDGAIVVQEAFGFPTWLRSVRQFENFDFRGEFFLKGWMDSGIYLHAPEHGRPMWNGMQIHLFHQNDETPMPQSMGAIFPVVAPRKINVKNQGEWNSFRILMEWPRLQVWTNDELIQDVDLESNPELRHRFRKGYLGFESLSYPIRFRNLRIKELPPKENLQVLYSEPADFESGTSQRASQSSPLRETFSIPMAAASSRRKRSSRISSFRCLFAMPSTTTEESSFAPPMPRRRCAPTRYSCTM